LTERPASSAPVSIPSKPMRTTAYLRIGDGLWIDKPDLQPHPRAPRHAKENLIKRICLVLLVYGFGFTAIAAARQAWPTQALRVIVPYGAGSATDIVPRIVFEQLKAQLGQTIVVENRSGAGGTIGASIVAKSAPNGYTLLVNSNAQTIAPALYRKLVYNPIRDFANVIPLGISPNVLVISPAKGIKTIGEFVTAAKAKPNAMTFASVGVGTATHLSGERFCFSAGVKALHVPFRSGAKALEEVMTGRVDFFFGPVGLVLPYIHQGKLVALVVSGAKRAAALPEVPTTGEAGFANAKYPIWFGLFAPAKTPRNILDKLHDETLKALQAPRVQKKLSALGVDPMVMTRTGFDAYVRKQVIINTALVKAIGIRPSD
jgi:tripartite-type tricarboxylate transporter receptor subunit TctC